LSRPSPINYLKSKENGSQVYIIEIFVEFPLMFSNWIKAMLRGWIKCLPMITLLLGAAVTLSGCNTISGTIGGVGRDISVIGNTLSGVSGDCRHERCGRVKRDCGPRGCRQTRRVASECIGRSCGRGHRYERVSHRERYAYRDRYSSRLHSR
jgi:predicted small secreted protein